MNSNTVILKTKEYNELRDFKEGIRRGDTYILKSLHSPCWNVFVSTEIAIKDLSVINNSLFEEIENIRLKQYEQTKNMSIFQFIKLKYTRRKIKTVLVSCNKDLKL